MWKQFLPFSPMEAAFAVILTNMILCCLAWSADSCLNASAPFDNKEEKYLAITHGLVASVASVTEIHWKTQKKILKSRFIFFSPPVSKASVSFGSKIHINIHTRKKYFSIIIHLDSLINFTPNWQFKWVWYTIETFKKHISSSFSLWWCYKGPVRLRIPLYYESMSTTALTDGYNDPALKSFLFIITKDLNMGWWVEKIYSTLLLKKIKCRISKSFICFSR